MENNFEDYIKDAMNNPPDFPFEERVWKDMESKLDEDKERKPLLGFVGRLPLFLLALGMTSLAGFFYMKQQKAMNRIVEVERQLVEYSTINTKTSTEPSLEKRVTVIYDTIYNRIVIDQLVQPTLRANNTAAPLERRFYPPNQFVIDFEQSVSDFIRQPEYAAVFNAIGLAKSLNRTASVSLLGVQQFDERTDETIDEVLVDWFANPLDQLTSVDYDLLDIDQGVVLPALNIIEKKRRKRVKVYLQKLKPSHFSFSGITGSFASLNLGGNGFNLRGMAQAELGLGKSSAIIAGVEFFANDFNKRIDPEDPNALKGFPELPPDNAEDILQNIQGDFTYLQIPFGIKQIIFPRRYFYPYIGAGLIAGRTNRSRLEYQYLSSGGTAYSISRGNLQPRNFELSAFWSTVGFQIQMNKRWSLLLEGSSQFDLEKGTFKYENLSLLKVGTGLRYQF